MADLCAGVPGDYLDLGYMEYLNGNFDRAIAEFSKAIAVDPDDVESYIARGDALFRIGETDKATTDYEKAIDVATAEARKFPENAHRYLLDRAGAYTRVGDYTKAIADYERALTLDRSAAIFHLSFDDSYSPFLRRGDKHRDEGSFELAISDYSRAIEIDGENTRALTIRGHIHYDLGHYLNAVADFRCAKDVHVRLAAHFGRDPEGTYGIDDEGNELTGRDKAAAELEKIAKIQPFLNRISSEIGISEPRGKTDKPSRRNLLRKTSSSTETFDHYFQEGAVHLQNAEYGRATKAFDKAIRLDPKHAESHCKRALASVRRGHFNKAIEYFERAVGIDAAIASQFNSDIATAYLERGVATKEKSPDRAIDSILIAIKFCPDLAAASSTELAEAYLYLGRRKARQRNYDEAISDFNVALELQTDFADAYNERGTSYARLGKYSEALKNCSKAIDLSPETARFHDSRGNLHSEQGKHDKAIEDYGMAIEAEPTFGISWFNDRSGALGSIFLTNVIFGQRRAPDYLDHTHTGLAYSDEGNYDKAVAHYNRAIALNSEHAIAYNNRGMIYGRRGEFKRGLRTLNKHSGWTQIMPVRGVTERSLCGESESLTADRVRK